MNRRIHAAEETELRFLCEKIELQPTMDIRGIVLRCDEIPRVIVGYDRWTTNAVEMHIWIDSPRYMGRDILEAAFRYPFGTGDRGVVLGLVRSDNPEALTFDRRIGFTPVTIIKDAYEPGVDMHILEMRRESCRWYKHGK